MNLFYTLSHRIYSSECDMEQRLRPGALVDLLIQAAIGSADSLGFGVQEMQKENSLWVLSQLSLEIVRPMKWKERIQVKSWPKDQQGAFYLRDFELHDTEGQVVVRAVSSWLALDENNKRPRRLQGPAVENLSRLKDKHALPYAPHKLSFSPKEHDKSIEPAYSDYDLNRHVTASRYIDWLFDSLPLPFLAANYPKMLSINYLREILPKNKLKLYWQQHGENEYHFEGKLTDNGKTAYRAQLGF